MRGLRSYMGLMTVVCTVMSVCGDNFFIDGYHGGIYGHYPVEWKTQFIVDKLNENPEWFVGLEIEPETWDTVQVRTPEAYMAFKKMLSSGRMEYTNPTYAQPYCYNINGESIIRQFSYGIEKLRKHFGDIQFTTYAVEEPCFTSCLPAILKGFGFKYASLKCPNTCWGGYMAPYGGQLVAWTGPDGTAITTVPRYACEELEPGSTWQTTAWRNSPRYFYACEAAGIENPVAMCYQDAGWRNGPWLGQRRGKTKYQLWTDYIENKTTGTPTDKYVMSQDDVRVNLMWGSQVLQRLAQQVRHAENAMIMAEKMGFIGGVVANTVADQPNIDEAWRQLMLAQHHDSWIVPYNGLWNFGTWADAIGMWTATADKVADDEISRLARAVEPGNIFMIKVFNTTLQDRKEVIKVKLPETLLGDGMSVILKDAAGKTVPVRIDDSNGKQLIFMAAVPAFGYSTYSVGRIKAPNKKSRNAEETVIENDRVKAVIDLAKGGVIKSLILKDCGKDFAPADTSSRSLCELRGFFYNEEKFRSSTENSARIVRHEHNELESSVTVVGEIAGNPFEMTYSLPAGSDRIDCSLVIDWKKNIGIGEYREKNWKQDRRAFCDDRYKLCLLFPVSFDADRLWKDAPFDVCESTQESTYFDRWSAIKHNVILNWIDFTDADKTMGMGVLSDHTTSYVHGPDSPVALTVQYSGQGLWGPNYKITGPTEVNFALVPHAGNGGAEAMYEQADRFNEPLIAVACSGSGKPSRRSLLKVANDGYRISAAKQNPDGQFMLRLHNVCADEPVHVTLPMPCNRINETDLLDCHIADVDFSKSSKGVAIDVEMPRNAFRTYSLNFK